MVAWPDEIAGYVGLKNAVQGRGRLNCPDSGVDGQAYATNGQIVGLLDTVNNPLPLGFYCSASTARSSASPGSGRPARSSSWPTRTRAWS